MITLGLLIFQMQIINILAFLIFPKSPAMFGNVLPDKWYIYPIHYLFPIYIIPYCYFNLGILAEVVVILGLVHIPFIVNELNVSRSKYVTTESLREAENLKLVYRMAQILQVRINLLFGRLLFPLQSFANLAFVFGSFVAIRHRDQMSTVPLLMVVSWTCAAGFGWGLVLVMGGYLQSHGVKILGSWKRHEWLSKKEKKEMAKFAKSCRPITLCYGKMFAIRKISLLVFLKGLSRGLIRAILTLDK